MKKKTMQPTGSKIGAGKAPVKKLVIPTKIGFVDKKVTQNVAVNRGEAPLSAKKKKPVDNGGTD